VSKLIRWIKGRVNWNAFCYSLHLFGSLILVVGGVKLGLPPHAAAIIALLIGLSKELFDMAAGNGFDKYDLMYDSMGIIIGFIMTAGYYR